MKYWEFYLAPTKYCDDIYHVGSETAPTYLVKSSDGIILIDTGLPKTLYFLLENIRSLGVDYHDIKHIIHSHGHIDHIGSTRALVELTGAKTYIGFGDEDTVRGVDQLQYTNEFNMKYEEPFEPDVIVHDGDIIKLGDKTFSFIATPGHSRGTMSIFFNCTDKGKTYRAGMFGGAGLLTMTYEYLDRYNLPHSLRDEFIKSIDKVMDEQVEIHLGNHLGDNRHREKLPLLLKKDEKASNPFIDNTTWQWFLKKRRAEAIEFFKEK